MKNKCASFLIIIILFMLLLMPDEARAWGAVENKTALSSSAMTHQDILRIAYQQLKNDKVIARQMNLFPDISEILKHEGVQLSNSAEVLVWGPRPIGGPDAEESGSKASEHYFNPAIPIETGEVQPTGGIPSTKDGTGGAPAAVKKWYLTLLEEMYLPENGKDESARAKGAAWSSHFLADMHMPYHTTGMPADWIINDRVITLTLEQCGGAVLWAPLQLKYEDDKLLTDSIIPPTFGWGGKDDFSSAIADYTQYRSAANSDQRDWFDPWYMNGGPTKHAPGIVKWFLDELKDIPLFILGFLSEKNWLAQIAFSSHGGWEAWAAQQFNGSKSGIIINSYSSEWENCVPTLILGQHLERQAARAEAFTIFSANSTKSRILTGLHRPVDGISKSIERTATLWRASISALEPVIEILPLSDPGKPNILKIRGKVNNKADNDAPTGVQAKLTVTGGTVQGEATPRAKPVISTGSQDTWEWDVTVSNPKSFKLKMEVIGTYKKIPDLGYAFIEKEVLGIDIDKSTPTPMPPSQNTIDISQYKKCHVEFHARYDGRSSDGISTYKISSTTFYFEGTFKDYVFKGVEKSNVNSNGNITLSVVPTNDPKAFKITGYSIQNKTGTPTNNTEYYFSGNTPMELKILENYGNALKAKYEATETCKYIQSYKEINKYLSSGATRGYTYDKISCDKNSWINFTLSK
jgi:hypothetical protein